MGTLACHTVFAGRYKILAIVGQGGMGQVYRAEHVGLGKEVALKVLGKRSPDWECRFEREARAVARLDHPGCVRILDHGEDASGQQYIAMELVEGPTLASALDAGAFSVSRAVQVARSLLSALAHAHAQGVLHRDVKPENVMFAQRAQRPVGGGSRVVLIDFGLASLRDAAPLTGSGFALGSPSYLAPERLLGHANDERGDLYAVGVLLYEMIAGIRPFVGASAQEIMTNALTRPPRPLRALVPDVSPALDAIVRRALAKDPAKRFADAEEMLSALADLELEAVPSDARADPASSMTMLELALVRPRVWQRAWAWLRYGAWRWRSEPSRA